MGSIQRNLRVAFTLAIVATLTAMTAGLASAAAPAKVAYNSVPDPLPGNVVSQAFQATQTSEFGDSVGLPGGPGSRKATSVEVVMSSWGCESGTWQGGCVTSEGATFSHPITLNLYAVDPLTGEPAALLLTETRTFDIPLRPSADPVNCSAAPSKWYSVADGVCYNGFATTIAFPFADKVSLPSNVIWTVAFNTSGYGSAPMGYSTTCAQSAAGCGYDSLNVGAEAFVGQPSKGTDTDPNGAVLNSATAGQYCDGGVGGTGFLRLDTGCWAGFTPLATIRTK